MFNATIKLGRILGIPIGLHYSWFIIFFLVTWLLSVNLFPALYPGWPAAQYWGVAVATSLLFFTSILLHELGHSIVALHYGIKVKSITLFVFGGVAHIAQDAPRPRVEALIAGAGPVVSVALGGLFLGLFFLTRDSNEAIAALSLYLGRINLIVAIFNLIPGFPLDGGRLFRAIAWAIQGNLTKATRIASLVGRGIGYIFILGGLLLAFWSRDIFNGLWLAFIGWFLEGAASQSYAHMAARDSLKGVRVREIMSGDVPRIPRQTDLGTLVENHMVFTGHRLFIVGEEGRWDGLLTVQEMRKVPRHRWSGTRVGDIMVPASQLAAVGPDDEALRVLEIMEETDLTLLPVEEDGAITGVVGREQILRFLRPRIGIRTRGRAETRVR